MAAEDTRTPDQVAADELKARIDLGKRGKLWRIEVLFKDGFETKRYEIRDRTGREVRNFREDIYQCGLAVAIDPGHFRVYSPFDILTVDVWKQDRYFGDPF